MAIISQVFVTRLLGTATINVINGTWNSYHYWLNACVVQLSFLDVKFWRWSLLIATQCPRYRAACYTVDYVTMSRPRNLSEWGETGFPSHLVHFGGNVLCGMWFNICKLSTSFLALYLQSSAIGEYLKTPRFTHYLFSISKESYPQGEFLQSDIDRGNKCVPTFLK